jgi:hypothetical protein
VLRDASGAVDFLRGHPIAYRDTIAELVTSGVRLRPMPLFEDKLEVKITPPTGDRRIACKHCHQPADRAETVGEFSFLLMCPGGEFTLGKWRTKAEREAEIFGFCVSPAL